MASPFWPEIIQNGAALSCNPVQDEIFKTFQKITSLNSAFDNNIFGDGNASVRIAEHLNNIAHS